MSSGILVFGLMFFLEDGRHVHDGCFFIYKHEHIFTNLTNLQEW